MIFQKNDLFAWGSTIFKATGECKVFAGVRGDSVIELLTFEMDMGVSDALLVCETLQANPAFLLIGSDSGYDDGEAEESEDEDEVVL